MATIKGGAKLEAALARLTADAKATAVLRVGFLEGATYPSRSKESLRKAYAKKNADDIYGAFKGSSNEDAVSVPMVAAIQEFGAPSRGIPPRPFFRNMVAEKQDEWAPAIGDLLKKTKFNVIKTLKLTGEAISGQLRQSIRDMNSPPNAQSTIERKGSSKPLVDTGHLLNSVDYDVKS